MERLMCDDGDSIYLANAIPIWYGTNRSHLRNFMSRNMDGFIEVKLAEQWYMQLMTDRMIVGGNTYAWQRLFGIDGDVNATAIAVARGIPLDASYTVAQKYRSLFDDPNLTDDYFGASWVLHAELQPFAEEIMCFHQGWQTLYRIMDALADLFGNQNVRLVVWFCL